MHRRAILVAVLALGPALLSGHAQASLDTDYLRIYLGLNDAERTEKAGDFKKALSEFEDFYGQLDKIRKDTPDWEPVLVQSRMEDCRAKVLELQTKLQSYSNFPAPTRHPTTNYPWKSNITTTVFWIGEDGTKASGWDTNWATHNGGDDDHYEMSGYASSKHASMLNPFYVALPFNDLRHPDEAKKYLPEGWAKSLAQGKPVSACQGRWIEIKNRAGRYCFAQWEDVGPEETNDPVYIFGAQRPKASAGLSISPAVAKYLGIDSTAITSWRFIDNEDVLPGMWLRYDEQAVLFRAMHEADAPAAKPNSL